MTAVPERAAIDRLRPADVPESAAHRVWSYCEADGRTAFAVLRWDWVGSNGTPRKEIRPATWASKAWTLGAAPEPRPLLHLVDLLADPQKPVMVAEGETCADAATRVFPDCAATAWAGGSNAWEKTGWRPLASRDVLLMADADAPGHKAMNGIAEHLAGLGCAVRVYLPNGGGGDDIADWIEADGAEAVRARIEAGARPWKPDADGADWRAALVEHMHGGDLDAIGDPVTRSRMKNLWFSDTLQAQLLRAKLVALPRVTAGLVDAAFGMDRGADEDDGGLQGRPVEWDDPDPWPEPVAGAALLDDMVARIRRYASLPDGGAVAVAVWSLFAWGFKAFGVCPNLMVTAPEKASGKTRVTELLSWMAPRPKPVSDASAAAIMRGIERNSPTLLFDEAQHFLKRRPEDPIRGILLASFTKRFAVVERCEGAANEPRVFSTFTPKAMNGRNVARLDDMLTSRSVVVPMTRATKPFPHLRADQDPVGEDIRRRCARWRDDHEAVLSVAEPDMGDLIGRSADVWRPLFAIADAAGGDWPGKIRRAARALTVAAATIADGETLGVQLLGDCRQVFKDRGCCCIVASAESTAALRSLRQLGVAGRVVHRTRFRHGA